MKVFLASVLLLIVAVGGYCYSRDISPIELYYSIANPYVRYINISEGWRKEQVADAFAKQLGWNQDQETQFMNSETDLEQKLGIDDGFYFPKSYVVPVDSSGTEVAQDMVSSFDKAIIQQYDQDPSNIRNLDTVLTIASIVQREAASKKDMNLIAGIIWNRIFHGMPLQVDATVQYAMGTENNWWPAVTPADLTGINSPYNTYLYPGLPPSPISNPGLAAIDAAMHPAKTSCLYYFHDNNKVIHCSDTGAEHVALVKKYLGGN